MYGSPYDSSGMAGPGATGTENVRWTTEEPLIMVRAIDFTVQPDATYRYQVRIVVRNPNQNREDVLAGVDTKSAELVGPWSEPTDEVTVPADVTIYALQSAPSDPTGEKVQFQVARWNPANGATIVDEFEEAPGQIVGQDKRVQVPNPEGGPAQTETIDFDSRILVVDTWGGSEPLNPLPMVGQNLSVPALAVVLRPDGTLTIRGEARDAKNPERLEMEKAYQKAKEPKPAAGAEGYPGGFDPSGRSGPGGYPGGGMAPGRGR